MANNPYDQFDQIGNPYDQFDKKKSFEKSPSVGRVALDNALQGASFGFSDEATAKLGSMLDPNLTYDDIKNQANEELKAGQEAHPVVALASQFGGGLLTSGGLGGTATGARIANSLRTGNAAARILKGIAAGAVSGGLYGAGTADEGDRLSGTAKGTILGGIAGGTIPAVSGAYGAVKDAVAPFTQSGRENIVAQTLLRQAQNPENLQKTAEQFIPNSTPTLGQQTGDYGLLSLERGLKNQKPELFAQRLSENNAARQQSLGNIAGTPEDIIQQTKARNVIGDRLRDEAFSNSKPVNTEQVNSVVKTIYESPVGKREAVRNSLDWVKSRLRGITDPQELYSVRQDIADAMLGKFDQDKPALRLAKKQLFEVRNALDDAIETGAPGYKNYLSKFREDSKPINQMETLQEIQGRIGLSSPDPRTGYDLISQPKMSQVFDKQKDNLVKNLSPTQFRTLENIVKDLDRESATNNPLVRASGSDTAQNLTTRNLVSNLVGNKIADSSLAATVLRPLSFAYKIPEEKVQDLLVQSLLDPEMAKQLLSKLPAKKAIRTGGAISRNVAKIPIVEVTPRDKR